MKIFISSDIEGVNGICHWDETERRTSASEYAYFTSKMTMEVAAVCNGINDHDPSADILVKDAHGSGRNIDHAALPENVYLNRAFSGCPLSMMNLLDGTYDASMVTGYHSPGYTNGNPLAHTMSGAFSKVIMNGKIFSEFHISYYTSLYFGVPMVLAAGDRALMELVKETDPDIVTVETFVGFGASVTSPHPNKTLSQLREAAAKAAAKAVQLKPHTGEKLPKHFRLEIRFREHSRAFKAAYYPNASKLDDHTVCYESNDYLNILRFINFV